MQTPHATAETHVTSMPRSLSPASAPIARHATRASASHLAMTTTGDSKRTRGIETTGRTMRGWTAIREARCAPKTSPRPARRVPRAFAAPPPSPAPSRTGPGQARPASLPTPPRRPHADSSRGESSSGSCQTRGQKAPVRFKTSLVGWIAARGGSSSIDARGRRPGPRSRARAPRGEIDARRGARRVAPRDLSHM